MITCSGSGVATRAWSDRWKRAAGARLSAPMYCSLFETLCNSHGRRSIRSSMALIQPPEPRLTWRDSNSVSSCLAVLEPQPLNRRCNSDSRKFLSSGTVS